MQPTARRSTHAGNGVTAPGALLSSPGRLASDYGAAVAAVSQRPMADDRYSVAAMSEGPRSSSDCRPSIDRYGYSRGLGSSLLGNLDLKYAIGIPCLDGLSSCGIRQGETPQERARDAFEVF